MDEQALIRAIRENPKDATAIKVFADWWQEFRDEGNAQLIRGVAEITRTAPTPELELIGRVNNFRGNSRDRDAALLTYAWWLDFNSGDGNDIRAITAQSIRTDYQYRQVEDADPEKGILQAECVKLQDGIINCFDSEGKEALRYSFVHREPVLIRFKNGMILDLNLCETAITSLPSGLAALKYITTAHSSLESVCNISAPDVDFEGCRYLRSAINVAAKDANFYYCSSLTELPGLSVSGELHLGDTSITAVNARRDILDNPNVSNEAKVMGLRTLGHNFGHLLTEARRMAGQTVEQGEGLV